MMKKIVSLISICIVVLSLIFTGCKKKDTHEVEPQPDPGTEDTVTPKLSFSGSKTTLDLKVKDSAEKAITFEWETKGFESLENVDYVLTFDSLNAGDPVYTDKVSDASKSKTLTTSELNKIALSAGLIPYQEGQIKVSLMAKTSDSDVPSDDVITLKITPYQAVRAPFVSPKNLFLIGSAGFDWKGGQTAVTQSFDKQEEVFSITTYLKADEKYVFVPEFENSQITYGTVDAHAPDVETNGDFSFFESDSIPSPDQNGWYEIKADFESGKYTVEEKNILTDPQYIPDSLYIVGNATDEGWTNPLPNPESQTLTKLNGYEFTITIDLNADKGYKFIAHNGSYNYEIGIEQGVTNANPLDGYFKIKPQESGTDDIPSPDETGTYEILLNFLDYTYTLTKK